MLTPDFFTLFKDCLPVLTGLFTLTTAGVFGYVLQHLKNLNDSTPEKEIQQVLSLKSQLKTNKKLDSVDEDRLNRIIDKLKEKAIEEHENYVQCRTNLFNKVLKNIGFLIGLAFIVAVIETLVYGFIIYGIAENNYWYPIIVVTSIVIQFRWTVREAK